MLLPSLSVRRNSLGSVPDLFTCSNFCSRTRWTRQHQAVGQMNCSLPLDQKSSKSKTMNQHVIRLGIVLIQSSSRSLYSRISATQNATTVSEASTRKYRSFHRRNGDNEPTCHFPDIVFTQSLCLVSIQLLNISTHSTQKTQGMPIGLRILNDCYDKLSISAPILSFDATVHLRCSTTTRS
jgi:hypothetical protein